jgi:hypothetical protein
LNTTRYLSEVCLQTIISLSLNYTYEAKSYVNWAVKQSIFNRFALWISARSETARAMSRFISTEECHASSYLHQSTSPPSTLRPIIYGYSILDAVVCVVCSENIVSKQSHNTSLGYVTPGLFSP